MEEKSEFNDKNTDFALISDFIDYDNKYCDESTKNIPIRLIPEDLESIISDEQIEDCTDKNRFQKVFENICRICLTEITESDKLKLIFDPIQCISDKIRLFTGVKITPNDGFPEKICSSCLNILNVCIEFKEQYEVSDMLIRKYVSEGYKKGMVLQSLSTESFGLKMSTDNSSNLYDKPYLSDDDHICPLNVEVINTSTANSAENAGQHDLLLNYSSNDSNNEILITEGNNLNCSRIQLAVNDSKALLANDIVQLGNSEKNAVTESSSDTNTCNLCSRSFANKITYKRHMKMHTSKTKLFYCAKCTRKFSNQMVFNRHMRCHNQTNKEHLNQDSSTYHCSICKYECYAEDDLYIHSSLHSEEQPPTCRGCKKVFVDKTKLKRHLPTHFKEKPFKCEICSKGYPEMASLTRHFKTHTNERKERQHACTTCGKKYFDPYSLTVHIRTHTGEKPWSCQDCGKSFTDSRLLNSHKKTHSGEKSFICNQCDKRFTHRSTLITHTRIHTGEKPYMCVVCSKSFKQASNLQLHMRTHSGEKPFKCEVCTKCFASSTTLSNHQNIHSAAKRFKCFQCDKHFVRGDLSAHMRVHSNEKPFECTHCKKKFRTKSQHKIHQQKHSNLKPYQCSKCNKSWSTISSLKNHLIKHKSEKIPINNQHDQRIVGGYDSEEELTLTNEALVDDLLASVGIKYDKNSSEMYCDSDNPKPNR